MSEATSGSPGPPPEDGNKPPSKEIVDRVFQGFREPDSVSTFDANVLGDLVIAMMEGSYHLTTALLEIAATIEDDKRRTAIIEAISAHLGALKKVSAALERVVSGKQS
jgi:hypothetical protein